MGVILLTETSCGSFNHLNDKLISGDRQSLIECLGFLGFTRELSLVLGEQVGERRLNQFQAGHLVIRVEADSHPITLANSPTPSRAGQALVIVRVYFGPKILSIDSLDGILPKYEVTSNQTSTLLPPVRIVIMS